MKLRIIIFSVLAALAASIVVMWRVFLSNALEGDNGEAIVLVYPNQSEDDVRRTLSEASVRTTGFRLLSRLLKYHVRPGRYIVRRGDSIVTIFRRLRNGQQEAVRLTIPSVRTVERLAANLDEHLMMDSLSAVEAFRDSIHLFLPNTYEVWWTVTTDDLMSRMQRDSGKENATEKQMLLDCRAARLLRLRALLTRKRHISPKCLWWQQCIFIVLR